MPHRATHAWVRGAGTGLPRPTPKGGAISVARAGACVRERSATGQSQLLTLSRRWSERRWVCLSCRHGNKLVLGRRRGTRLVLVAVMPDFVVPAAGHLPLQLLALGTLFPAIALLLDSIWAVAAGTARTWLARSPRRLTAIGGTGGLVMIALGTSLAFTGRRD